MIGSLIHDRAPAPSDIGATFKRENMSETLPYLVSAEYLAAQLSISYRSILRWAKERKMPHYRFGKLVRFDPEEVREWLRQKEGKCAN